jgi:hypothetical protein
MAEKRMALLVPEGIHGWIMEEIERLCLAVENGQTECEAYNPDVKNPKAPKISVGAFLELLLEQRRKHRARRRTAGYNRRGKAKRRPSPANVERVLNADVRG